MKSTSNDQKKLFIFVHILDIKSTFKLFIFVHILDIKSTFTLFILFIFLTVDQVSKLFIFVNIISSFKVTIVSLPPLQMSPDPPSHAHPTFKPLLPPRLAVSEVTSVIVVTSEVSPSVPAATPASNDKNRKENQIETGFIDRQYFILSDK